MKLDFHSHILPGIDDGATDIDNAVELVSAMKGWGFEKITCTPHINALYPNKPSDIERAFDALQSALEERHIDIPLTMSAEYRLVPETWPEVLEKNWIMPIEDRYILTELPISKPEEMRDIKPLEEFRKLISMGLTPILPHPERYFYLTEQELSDILDAGGKIQCNYGSYAGLYGEEVRQRAVALQDKGMVSFYGTDLHNAHYVQVIGSWFAAGNSIREYNP
jgi:tyrosine-protein phosphatase YwqE